MLEKYVKIAPINGRFIRNKLSCFSIITLNKITILTQSIEIGTVIDYFYLLKEINLTKWNCKKRWFFWCVVACFHTFQISYRPAFNALPVAFKNLWHLYQKLKINKDFHRETIWHKSQHLLYGMIAQHVRNLDSMKNDTDILEASRSILCCKHNETHKPAPLLRCDS